MAEAPNDKEEAARVRRRWLTLGELLAIAAVAISALTFWNSYRERTNAEAEHRNEAAHGAQVAAALVLKASPAARGRRLTLAARADNQTIQSQTIRFPKALGLAPIETTGDPRIERDWIEDALIKARKAAGVDAKAAGDAQLPLLIETHYLVDAEPHVDRALYRLGYATTHGFLAGTGITLRGLSRTAAVANEAAGQARLDTWTAAAN